MGIPKMYDLTGKRFDKLVVIKYDHSDKGLIVKHPKAYASVFKRA